MLDYVHIWKFLFSASIRAARKTLSSVCVRPFVLSYWFIENMCHHYMGLCTLRLVLGDIWTFEYVKRQTTKENSLKDISQATDRSSISKKHAFYHLLLKIGLGHVVGVSFCYHVIFDASLCNVFQMHTHVRICGCRCLQMASGLQGGRRPLCLSRNVQPELWHQKGHMWGRLKVHPFFLFLKKPKKNDGEFLRYHQI